MPIQITRMRHTKSMGILEKLLRRKMGPGRNYIAIVYDGPESVNREASWSSSANNSDVKLILAALSQQIEVGK